MERSSGRARGTVCEYLTEYIRQERPPSIAAWVPEAVQEHLRKSIAILSKNNGLTLIMALSYGGRTEIAWDGSIPRRALNTGSLTEAGRCESLLGQVLAIPPPYRATPGRPVYVIHASDRAVLMGEENLIGSLQHLVTTILAAGDPC